MTLAIRDPALPDDLGPLLAAVQAAYPAEACGVILAGSRGMRMVVLPNAAPEPRAHFAFELAAWLALLEDADQRGEQIRCVFHSHPDASAVFSPEDEAWACADGRPRVPGAAQLVIAVEASGIRALRLYRWAGHFFAELARTEAAI